MIKNVFNENHISTLSDPEQNNKIHFNTITSLQQLSENVQETRHDGRTQNNQINEDSEAKIYSIFCIGF